MEPEQQPNKQHKGTGKGTGKPSNMAMLAGKCRQTAAGEPICFNYNLRGCSGAAAGQRCERGWHLCAEPGFQKAHPLSEHRS